MKSLVGQRVLVTRPQQQALDFIRILEQHGHQGLLFPSMEILPLPFNDALKATLHSLDEIDVIIFISANAVKYLRALLQTLRLEPNKLLSKIAVIGQATNIAAAEAGFNVTIKPQSEYTSEALLAHNELQQRVISGQKILIIRGEQGREALADCLQQRGAHVSYAELYKRIIPKNDGDISRLQLTENWDEMGISCITILSNESLQNLYDMLQAPGQKSMLNVPLIVPSMRCFQLAKKLGFSSVKTAGSATNEDMLLAINTQ